MRPSLTQRAAIPIFRAKYLALADYASLFMSFLSNKCLKKLQVLQNACLRCVFKKPKRTNMDTYHCKLNVLHIVNRNYLNLLAYMHKKVRTLYGYRASGVVDPGPASDVRMVTRSQCKITMYPNRPTSDRYSKSFVYQGAIEWNRLTLETQSIDDCGAFKKSIKRMLLNQEQADLVGNQPS